MIRQGRDRQKGVGMRFWFTTQQDLDALAHRSRRQALAIAPPGTTN